MNTTSTQVAYPWRTTLRTIVWVIVAVVLSIPAVWPIVLEETRKAGLTIPAGVEAKAAVVVAVIVTLIGVVQRVVLLPRIADLIARIPGLAPAPVASPKRAIEEG